MNWLYYLLEANLYLITFYGFYRLLLHKETFYALNRGYLLITSLISFLIPIFQLGILKKPEVLQVNLQHEQVINQLNFTSNQTFTTVQEPIFTVENVIIVGYLLVTFFFFIKLAISLMRILSMQRSPFKELENGVKLIDMKDSKVAFSFFNLLFLDPQMPEKSTIIKHELVHIKQKHSIDVLIFELIQTVNWFNPLTYFIKDDVKLNHEYLADEETTHLDIEKYKYAMFLINNSSGVQNLKLPNQIFNSSILKRRISMLNQKKSTPWARLKLLSLLPIICGMLCMSTMAFTKNYKVIDLYTTDFKVSIKQDTVKKSFETKDGIKIIYPDLIYLSFHSEGKSKRIIPNTKKLIVINGKESELGTFGAITNINIIITLTPENGQKKYGDKGKYGVIEVFGSNIKTLLPPPPPAPPKVSDIILPPPPPTEPTSPPNSPPKAPKMQKTILLPPPPMDIKNRTFDASYNLNVEIDRSKNDKLVSPETEFGRKSVSIYTERGEKVYISSNYKDDWDGKVDALKKPLSPGQYSYEMKLSPKKEGKIKIIRGYITLK